MRKECTPSASRRVVVLAAERGIHGPRGWQRYILTSALSDLFFRFILFTLELRRYYR